MTTQTERQNMRHMTSQTGGVRDTEKSSVGTQADYKSGITNIASGTQTHGPTNSTNATQTHGATMKNTGSQAWKANVSSNGVQTEALPTTGPQVFDMAIDEIEENEKNRRS